MQKSIFPVAFWFLFFILGLPETVDAQTESANDSAAFQVLEISDLPYAKAMRYWTQLATQSAAFDKISMMTQAVDEKLLDLRLDLFLPLDDSLRDHPLVMLIHGGAFYFGSKDDVALRQWCQHLASQGFVTRDVQTSEVEYTINYDLVRENVSKLMKNVGDDYHNRIVVPFIRSAMKESFGNFAATEIVENRDAVRRQIEQQLRETLDANYFMNIQFQLVNIDFDDDFETAIKEKQVAEQNALKAKNVTIQVEEQAKQTKIKAQAEAEAMSIKAAALESNPKLVNYEAVQKWDGKLPQYMLGNSVPFIDLK